MGYFDNPWYENAQEAAFSNGWIIRNGREILFQGFNWESHKLDWWGNLEKKVPDLAESGFTSVWLPPATHSFSPEGYLPQNLYSLDSSYGSELQLKALLQKLSQHKIRAMADIVINHRVGTSQGHQGRYNRFDGIPISWDEHAITSCSGGMGNKSTGCNFPGVPNIDHTQPFVRKDIINWLIWLHESVKFQDFRFDFAKGYEADFVKEYIEQSKPIFSVGEYWDSCSYSSANQLDYNQDSHRQRIINWIDKTGGLCAAFDFTTKGILQEAVRGELWRLRDPHGKPPGLVGWWPSRAVTFIENHDTGSTQSHWPFPSDHIMEGYAYILTHPGIPTVFYDHFYDWGKSIHDQIVKLMDVRRHQDIHSRSTIRILESHSNLYAAIIGEKLCIKIGDDSWCPTDGEWKLATSGSRYAVWCRMENPDSEETKAFVEAQAALTDSVLAECGERERLREEITKLFDHPRYETPFKRGGKYFYFHNSGLQAQSVLYVQNDLDSEAEVLLDPNALSEDGTVALSTYEISRDGKYLAYGLSLSGSDWVTIKVMRIADKEPEPDTISWVKFSSISWTHDGKGFFYGRYPAPKEGGSVDAGTETDINLNHQLYYHFLGTEQSDDVLCWKDPENPKYIFDTYVTEDGKYVTLSISEGCDPVNKLYYCDLSAPPGGLDVFKGCKDMLPFVKLVDNFEARYDVVANNDTEITFLTNKESPKYKLVRVDLSKPEIWTDVLPEDPKDVLESAYAVNGNQLLVCYLSDVKYILQIRDLKTGHLLHNLPIDIGTVTGISGKRKDSEIFIGFTSFLTPGLIYKCKLSAEVPEMKVFREVSVPGFNRDDFQVNQVFASSKDGTKIPMFIVSSKDITLDGSHPTLLYGYGGFNISLTPSFSVGRIVLARNLGFVFCVANIRGGGEYGEEWHKSGSLSKKQNCFDDFIAASEFLISNGYTNSRRLCIEGGSNGGLLIAACINQRPDLFGCAIAHVGVMDMLRFHKFTIGHAWTSDYGCSDTKDEFQWLIKYSPLHNVQRPWEKTSDSSSQYPPTMLLTADHDDRVVPLHSLKLLAAMQYILCTSLENSPQKNPIIARIDRKAGHGAGRPTQKLIDEAADRYGFAAKMMGASWNG